MMQDRKNCAGWGRGQCCRKWVGMGTSSCPVQLCSVNEGVLNTLQQVQNHLALTVCNYGVSDYWCHWSATKTPLAAGEKKHNFQSRYIVLQCASTRRAGLLETLATFIRPGMHASLVWSRSPHGEPKWQVDGSFLLLRSLLRPSGTTFHSQFVSSIPSMRSSCTSTCICSVKTLDDHSISRTSDYGCFLQTEITARNKLTNARLIPSRFHHESASIYG